MAEPDTQSAQDAGELDEALLRAISHPLRHRLLGMLDGRIASPNMLARELDLPLGRVSYHIRLLNDLGAIELVRTEPRRGALEHFYRAVTTVWFSEGDWTKLPRSARRGILGQNLQQIFGDVTAAADDGRLRPPVEPRPARAAASSTRRAWTSSRACCARRSTAPASSAPSGRHGGDLRRSFRPALRAPRVSSKLEHGRPSTRARRGCGGSGAGRRVDRRARAPADPRGDGHDDHRRRRGRRRLRAGARAGDPPGGALDARRAGFWGLLLSPSPRCAAASPARWACCCSSARCRPPAAPPR